MFYANVEFDIRNKSQALCFIFVNLVNFKSCSCLRRCRHTNPQHFATRLRAASPGCRGPPGPQGSRLRPRAAPKPSSASDRLLMPMGLRMRSDGDASGRGISATLCHGDKSSPLPRGWGIRRRGIGQRRSL